MNTWTLNGLTTGSPLNNPTFAIDSDTIPAGQYLVGIETNDGHTTLLCPGADQLVLTVVPMPAPQLGPDTTLSTLTLDAGNGALYQWSTGEQTQTITIYNSGLYQVTVDGGNNTRRTVLAQIGIVALPIPDIGLWSDTCVIAPSPISAGVNNAFVLWSTGETTPVITPQISGYYSVTATYFTTTFWDGADHADGVYFYVFHLKTRNAKGETAYLDYNGSVTIFR